MTKSRWKEIISRGILHHLEPRIAYENFQFGEGMLLWTIKIMALRVLGRWGRGEYYVWLLFLVIATYLALTVSCLPLVFQPQILWPSSDIQMTVERRYKSVLAVHASVTSMISTWIPECGKYGGCVRAWDSVSGHGLLLSSLHTFWYLECKSKTFNWVWVRLSNESLRELIRASENRWSGSRGKCITHEEKSVESGYIWKHFTMYQTGHYFHSGK